MIAVFYDRKNKREITSDQLVPIHLNEQYAVGDDDDEFVPTGRRMVGPNHECFTRAQFDRYEKEGFFKQKTIADHYPDGLDWDKLKEEVTPYVLYLRDRQIANLGYKSEHCPDYRNWDLSCQIGDLVFLRLDP